jgi:hypothetical protein
MMMATCNGVGPASVCAPFGSISAAALSASDIEERFGKPI